MLILSDLQCAWLGSCCFQMSCIHVHDCWPDYFYKSEVTVSITLTPWNARERRGLIKIVNLAIMNGIDKMTRLWRWHILIPKEREVLKRASFSQPRVAILTPINHLYNLVFCFCFRLSIFLYEWHYVCWFDTSNKSSDKYDMHLFDFLHKIM